MIWNGLDKLLATGSDLAIQLSRNEPLIYQEDQEEYKILHYASMLVKARMEDHTLAAESAHAAMDEITFAHPDRSSAPSITHKKRGMILSAVKTKHPPKWLQILTCDSSLRYLSLFCNIQDLWLPKFVPIRWLIQVFNKGTLGLVRIFVL